MHAMAGDPRKLAQSRQLGIDGTCLAELFGQARLDELGRYVGSELFLHRAVSGFRSSASVGWALRMLGAFIRADRGAQCPRVPPGGKIACENGAKRQLLGRRFCPPYSC